MEKEDMTGYSLIRFLFCCLRQQNRNQIEIELMNSQTWLAWLTWHSIVLFSSLFCCLHKIVTITDKLEMYLNYLTMTITYSMWWNTNKRTIQVMRIGMRRGRSTSAAGMPSGGRHCSSTSCSSRTSRPSGSCSKFFLRSTGGDTDVQ